MLQDINSRLECAEREKRTLDSLQCSGKISKVTYDQLKEGYAKIICKMRDLKETLEQEEDFWKLNSDEQTRALERILAILEFNYISDKIDPVKWKRVKDIVTLGLDSMSATKKPSTKPPSRPGPSNSTLEEETETLKSDESTETKFLGRDHDMTIPEVPILLEVKPEKIPAQPKKSDVGLRFRKKTKSRFRRNKPKTRNDLNVKGHCENPWNAKCRNTDIEVSIYYRSEFLPICRECWQEISARNLEWSSA